MTLLDLQGMEQPEEESHGLAVDGGPGNSYASLLICP
ncbi:MAG: SapB/AmfS family lanthipeptide [Pseudonocardiales bacterium]|nr:SapB/AmfS family lanthipeptide [Pseudonocardiales bacterium]MBV9031016.1 SapB/AmfS family lanthipeptide [Pseudonocardiales bacterium]